MTQTHYRLYNLVIASDIELALSTVDPDDIGDRPVWTCSAESVELPPGRLVHDVLDFDGKRRLKVWVDDERGVFFSHGETRAQWNEDEQIIRIEEGEQRQLGPGVLLERVVAPISMIIQRPNHVALHASAVLSTDGGAWIFVGHSGAGKSTTALELRRRGFPLLSDDLVMIDGDSAQLLVATPTVRLFDRPEQVPEAIDNRPVLTGRDKFWYRLGDDKSCPVSVPVRAIVSLEPTDADDGPDTAELEEIGGREATVRVIAQAFDLTEADAVWRAARFRTLCELTRNISVHRLVYRPVDRDDPAQVAAIAAVMEA